VDDNGIRTLLTRLARPHPSGGKVIERAAIVSQGLDSTEVLRWITAHEGRPETLTPRAAARGLHSARLAEDHGGTPREPLRYVLPAGALTPPEPGSPPSA
jgi:hypothetical protein